MLAFYPEGSLVLPSDNELRTLHKLAFLNGGGTGSGSGTGGGGSGTGAQEVYQAASPPAAPDDPTKPAVFYPSGGGSMQQWDVVSQAWV